MLLQTHISLCLYFQFLWVQTQKRDCWLGGNGVFNFLGTAILSKKNPFIFFFTSLLPILQGPSQVSPIPGSPQFLLHFLLVNCVPHSLAADELLPCVIWSCSPWVSCILQIRLQIPQVQLMSCSGLSRLLIASSSETRTRQVLRNIKD